jgi:hypothetical protein
VRERILPGAAALLVLLLLALAREVVFPVRALFAHLPALLWWAVLAAAAWAQGRLLLRALAGGDEDPAGTLAPVLSLGLGLGALALEAFALAALGAFTPPALTLLVAGSAAGGASLLARRMRAGAPAMHAAPSQGSLLPWAITALAALLLLPFALLPPRAFDALSYHLELPARFLAAGRLLPLPETVYSSVPLLPEMLYGIGLALEGTALTGLVGFSFFLLTLGLVACWGGREFGKGGGAWAAAILATIPLGMMEVPARGSDWPACFFTLAAVMLLAKKGLSPRGALTAGVLAGLAAGCKHPALAFAILAPPVALVLCALLQGRRPPYKTGAVFLAAAACTALPWYLKNAIMTGDPFYPLFSHLSQGGSVFTAPLQAGMLPRLAGAALAPLRAVFDPPAHNGSATLGVLPLALIPLLFLRGEGKEGTAEGEGREDRAFLPVWAFLCFLGWAATFAISRYALPLLAAAALPLGAALARALAGALPPVRVLLAATVALAAAANLGTFLALAQWVDGSVGAALGTQSPQRWLRETHPPYAALEYLNRLDPPPGKVLFVGEMRGFYARFPREVPSNGAPNRLLEAARRGSSPADMRRELSAAGFTHLLLNPAEWERMARSTSPGWALPDAGRGDLERFLREESREVFSFAGVSVRELRGGR